MRNIQPRIFHLLCLRVKVKVCVRAWIWLDLGLVLEQGFEFRLDSILNKQNKIEIFDEIKSLKTETTASAADSCCRIDQKTIVQLI